MEIAHKMLISKKYSRFYAFNREYRSTFVVKKNTNSLENKMRYPKLDKTSFKESLLKYYPFIFSFCPFDIFFFYTIPFLISDTVIPGYCLAMLYRESF
jgi:hypothetical protein